MTRTKPAGQRRADLLAAGQELFLADGIAATSLEDITSRAGVSKGLFYLYFGSKEDLVLALQEQFSRQLAERVCAAAYLPADWPARLDACVQAIFDGYRDSRDVHEVLFRHAHHHEHEPHGHAHRSGHGHGGKSGSDSSSDSTSSAPHPPGAARRPAHGQLTQVICDLLAAGTAAGAFDVPDPETTAVLCHASMHAFDSGFRGPDGPDDGRLIEAARQLFRRAAGVQAGPIGK